MGMPTEQELEMALKEAARMREVGEDFHHVAKALLNCHYQVEQLTEVLQAVDRFLNTGMGVTEHQKLKKKVEKARHAIDRTGGIERSTFGLR